MLIQVSVMDKRDYILDYKDFDESKSSMLAMTEYIATKLLEDQTRVIRIQKWRDK